MKRILGLMLVCALMGGLLMQPALAASFPDVDDAAGYAEAVEVLFSMGIMQGEPDGNFHPNGKVTRGQMAAIICQIGRAHV